MLHRRTAAVLLTATALTLTACGSTNGSTGAKTVRSASASAGGDAAAAGLAAKAQSLAGSMPSSAARPTDDGSDRPRPSASTSAKPKGPTDLTYCTALSKVPATSSFKTLGDDLDGLTLWAKGLKAVGLPADMPADAAAAARDMPAALLKAIKGALGGVDRSTPASEVKSDKDLQKKLQAAVAPLATTLGADSPFSTWASKHCVLTH